MANVLLVSVVTLTIPPTVRWVPASASCAAWTAVLQVCWNGRLLSIPAIERPLVLRASACHPSVDDGYPAIRMTLLKNEGVGVEQAFAV
jgi:hypothetical protein